MRNLKKVLALVLAMAMSLSLAVSAGAATAFTDADSIDNAAAVDYCVALGIINGYEDGSFRPDDTISRAEATKLISIAMNGGEAAIVDNGKSSFSDVLTSATSKWANKFIEFGVAAGFVAGMGDGTFAPDANVTGSQLSKMLLVACGYNAVEEGYVGSSWELNVNVDAAKAGLYDGLAGIVPSEALSRDDAAQMIWNALNAERVGRGVTTLLADKFGASLDAGIMTAIDYNHDTKVYTYFLDRDGMDFANAENDQFYTKDEFAVESKTAYNELFAQNVEVLVKGDDALAMRCDKGGIVFNEIVDDVDEVVNTHSNTIEVNGVKYKLDNEANDRDDVMNMICGFNKYYDRENPEAFEQYSFVGIDQDGGGDVDVMILYPFVVLKTESVGANSFEAREILPHDAALTFIPVEQDQDLVKDVLADGMNASYENNRWSSDIEFDDVTVYGEIPAYGYVLVIPAEYTAQDQDVYIPLEVKSDVVTKLSDTDETITLGDTTYDSSKLEWFVGSHQQLSVGQTYSYVEVNGFLYMVDGDPLEPAISDYAVVTDVAIARQGLDKTYATEILCTDGTTAEIEVDIAINNWLWYADQDDEIDPVHAINLYKQHVLGHGTEYCAVCDQTAKPEVGTLYTVHENDDGNYYLLAVTERVMPWDSVFDVYAAWQDGATLNNEFAPMNGDNEEGGFYTNHGETGIYGEDSIDNFFDLTGFHQKDKMYIEDDAIVFAFNKNTGDYYVITGDDLATQDVHTVNWAFAAATEKADFDVDVACTATVDLAYVMVDHDPTETTVVAEVVDVVRTQVEGKWVVSVDVILDGGVEATYTTEGSVIEQNLLQHKLYNLLDEGSIVELIVDETTLVDVKNYEDTVVPGIWEIEYGAVDLVTEKAIYVDGVPYTVDEDTIILNSGDPFEIDFEVEPTDIRYMDVDGDFVFDIIEW